MLKRHGRWSSESAKDGYIKDSVEERLKVSRSLGFNRFTLRNDLAIPPVLLVQSVGGSHRLKQKNKALVRCP